MNIAVIMPLAEQRGGGELMLYHLLLDGRLPDVRWCIVFLNDGPMVAQARDLGIETHVVEMGRLRYVHRTIAAVGRIAAIVRRFHADIVFGWMAMGQIYGSLAARLAGVPAAWYQLGIAQTSCGVDRVATRLPARGIIACSQEGVEAQVRLNPKRPMRVVYPGAELERFNAATRLDPGVARQNLGLPPTGPCIGIIGRLQRWKGMHVLIEAMPSILQSHADACAVIVGGVHASEPDYPDYLTQRIAAMKLEGRVVLAGLQRNIPEWMQAMDVIVHASDREPFGIVIIEAMAMGKPVVAGNTGGPIEIITEGVNGLLAPYGDAEALAQAILRYLNDPGLAARMGKAAQQRAADFSTQRYAENFVAAVRELKEQHL